MKILFSFIVPIALFFAVMFGYPKLVTYRGRMKRLNPDTASNVKKVYFISLAAIAVICLLVFLVIAMILDSAISTPTGFSKFLIFITMLCKSVIFSELITNVLYKRININRYMGQRKFFTANGGRVHKNNLLKAAIADGVINIICALAVVL